MSINERVNNRHPNLTPALSPMNRRPQTRAPALSPKQTYRCANEGLLGWERGPVSS